MVPPLRQVRKIAISQSASPTSPRFRPAQTAVVAFRTRAGRSARGTSQECEHPPYVSIPVGPPAELLEETPPSIVAPAVDGEHDDSRPAEGLPLARACRRDVPEAERRTGGTRPCGPRGRTSTFRAWTGRRAAATPSKTPRGRCGLPRVSLPSVRRRRVRPPSTRGSPARMLRQSGRRAAPRARPGRE